MGAPAKGYVLLRGCDRWLRLWLIVREREREKLNLSVTSL